MPLKDSFISLLYRRLTAVIQQIKELQQAQRPEAAYEALNEAYRELTGSEAALIRRLPTEQLLPLLSSTGSIDGEKCYIIAVLLQAEMVLDEALGVAALGKAYTLLLEAALAEIDAPDLHIRITELGEVLENYDLSLATQWRVLDYRVQQEHYAKAEDQLFDMLGHYGASEVATRGRAFYRRLLQTKAERLAQGGLPLAEVEEGLAAFEAALTES